MSGDSASIPPSGRSVRYLLRFGAPMRSTRGVTCWRLAWPAYAWRAILTKVPESRLDALERLLLRLIKAGKTDPAVLANLIGLQPTLVSRIITALIGNRCLTDDVALTSYGLQRLEDRYSYSLEELVRDSGWLFQDALSGDVVPYVHYGSLPDAPASAAEDAVALPHGDRQIGSPSDRSIAYALRAFAHLRRLREDSEEDGEISGAGDSGGGMLEEVFWDDLEEEYDEPSMQSEPDSGGAPRTSVSEAPRLARLVTAVPEEVDIEVFLYVSAHMPGRWQLWLPIGTELAAWFARKLRYATARDPHLEATIDRLVGPMKDDAKTGGTRSKSGSVEALVLREFPNVAMHAELATAFSYAVEAIKAEEVAYEGRISAGHAIMSYSNCLEAMMTACFLTLTKDQRIRLASHFDFAGVSERIQGIAASLSVPVPSHMCRDAYRSRFRLAAHYPRSASARDKILLLLADAYYRPESPAREAFLTEPRLVELVDRMNTIRNDSGAAHAKQFPTHLDADRWCPECRELIRSVASHLLPSYFGRADSGKAES